MSASASLRPTTLLARLAARVLLATSGRRGASRVALADAGSVLVVKLDALGDFVLATPFLRALRQAAPRARITLLVRRVAAPLARTCPHVDDVHVFEPDPTPRSFGALRTVRMIDACFRRTLGNRRFDIAFVPRTGPDNHGALLVAWLSGAPVRVGFATTPSDPITRSAALTRAVAYPASPLPEAEANLLLLRDLGLSPAPGPLELHASAEETSGLEHRLAAANLGADTSLLALGVGASLPHKLWPAARFLALARHFIRERGWPVILLGDAGDAARFPRDEPGLHNWAGQLTPNQSFALLRRARLFVGNDSGALHLAAAAGCPTVVITWDRADSASADVNSHHRFGPYGVPHRLVHPATPDGRRDAALVTLEQAIAACDSLLAETTTRAPAR